MIALEPVTGGSGITELTGDVTAGPGSGAQVATIAAGAVGDAEIRDAVALSVIGRAVNSVGDVADIAAGADGDILRRSGVTLGFGAAPASSISKGAWPNWATGLPPVATDVEAGLDILVTELADNVGVTADGASRIGADAYVGATTSLTQGSVRSQLNQLADAAGGSGLTHPQIMARGVFGGVF